MGTEERYVDKLAKYILLATGTAIVVGICWYFRSVLIYILAAVVVSLIGKPMMKQLQKMKEDGTGFPAMKSWFLDLFPKFNVEKARKEIREYRLGNVKAKYKVVKTAPKNRKPASNISELPKASGND